MTMTRERLEQIATTDEVLEAGEARWMAGALILLGTNESLREVVLEAAQLEAELGAAKPQLLALTDAELAGLRRLVKLLERDAMPQDEVVLGYRALCRHLERRR